MLLYTFSRTDAISIYYCALYEEYSRHKSVNKTVIPFYL